MQNIYKCVMLFFFHSGAQDHHPLLINFYSYKKHDHTWQQVCIAASSSEEYLQSEPNQSFAGCVDAAHMNALPNINILHCFMRN